MALLPDPNFRVIHCRVTELEHHMNELCESYPQITINWFPKGDEQWVSVVFAHKRMMRGAGIARPVGVG